MKPNQPPKDATLAVQIHWYLHKAAEKKQFDQRPYALSLISEARTLAAQVIDDCERIGYLKHCAGICEKLGSKALALEILDELLEVLEEASHTTVVNYGWTSTEDQAQWIKMNGLHDSATLFIRLGFEEKGFSLLERALGMAFEQRKKQIRSYPSLGQFAYTYGSLGEIDRAIAIADHLTAREAVLDVFSELSLLYLSGGKHHDLIKMLTTSAWTGWQVWVAREIIDHCFDEVFMNQYATLANPTYPLRLLQDLEDIETQISLLIALGREYFGWGQDDLALHYLEKADEKISRIPDANQRERLRGWVNSFLTNEPDW